MEISFQKNAKTLKFVSYTVLFIKNSSTHLSTLNVKAVSKGKIAFRKGK